jgi:hypothetical protein
MLIKDNKINYYLLNYKSYIFEFNISYIMLFYSNLIIIFNIILNLFKKL